MKEIEKEHYSVFLNLKVLITSIDVFNLSVCPSKQNKNEH